MAPVERHAAVTLPRADNHTLGQYLLSVAETLHLQINGGFGPDAAGRLRECATIIARVAQQIDQEGAAPADVGAEVAALAAGEAAFAAGEASRAEAGLRPPPPSARQLDPDAVAAYLRLHPLGAPNLAITSSRLLPGGRCKLTALVSQIGSPHLPESFILRQDWQGGATDTTVAGEHALLGSIAGAGIRAPAPLLLETDPAVLGAPFILLERMQGKLTGSLFTPPLSAALGLQLAEQLGRLHGLASAPFAGLVPNADAATPDGVAAFRRMQATIGLPSKIIDAAIDWLEGHFADAGSAICLIHNDLGFHNFLTDGEALTALLDWELASLGHPAADLGYIKPFVGLMLPWPDFVAAYEAAGGWRVDPVVLRFHTIWNAVRLYGLIMQARAAIAAGIVNDVEITFACADNTMLLLNALAGELAAA